MKKERSRHRSALIAATEEKMDKVKPNRRDFLVRSAGVVAGSVFGSAMLPLFAHAQGSMGQGDTGGYVTKAGVEKRCGTCDFWGGPRRLSSDGKTITITGLGWCNNPKSPMYQKITTPEHGPMDTWRKWGALG